VESDQLRNAELVGQILAGGLTESNVENAIRRVRPWAVDVNSGVKLPDGSKSTDSIARFVAAAKKWNRTG
jgi:phosphoribosylanthranilate isomerase